jgi:hypothetical protein
MTVDFSDLKKLSEQDIGLPLSQVLENRASQYQDVTPEAILPLLEQAAQTYAVVAPTLPHRLRSIAQKEIEFFLSLYQEKIRKYRPGQNPQPPQNILQLIPL